VKSFILMPQSHKWYLLGVPSITLASTDQKKPQYPPPVKGRAWLTGVTGSMSAMCCGVGMGTLQHSQEHLKVQQKRGHWIPETCIFYLPSLSSPAPDHAPRCRLTHSGWPLDLVVGRRQTCQVQSDRHLERRVKSPDKFGKSLQDPSIYILVL
jgi:hypothetical protein